MLNPLQHRYRIVECGRSEPSAADFGEVAWLLREVTCAKGHTIRRAWRRDMAVQLREKGLLAWRCGRDIPVPVANEQRWVSKRQCGRLTFAAHVWGQRYVLVDVDEREVAELDHRWIRPLIARSQLPKDNSRAGLEYVIARDRALIESLEFLEIPAETVLGPEYKIQMQAFALPATSVRR